MDHAHKLLEISVLGYDSWFDVSLLAGRRTRLLKIWRGVGGATAFDRRTSLAKSQDGRPSTVGLWQRWVYVTHAQSPKSCRQKPGIMENKVELKRNARGKTRESSKVYKRLGKHCFTSLYFGRGGFSTRASYGSAPRATCEGALPCQEAQTRRNVLHGSGVPRQGGEQYSPSKDAL